MSTRYIVEHAYYGCDTGCCGHTTIKEVDGTQVGRSIFDFTHPYGEDKRKFAEMLVEENFGADAVKDLDFDASSVSDD